jgi:type 1 fimbria pilin
MRRYLVAVLVLASVALAAGAVPAFTADSGTISVSITAQAPPAPCIELVGGTLVDFGTHAFSTLNQPSSGPGDIEPSFRNCSSADEEILIHGADATGPSATWTLDPNGPYPCDAGSPRNTYQLGSTVEGSTLLLANTPATLLASAAPAVEHTLALFLVMPCAGSDGAGQTLTTSVELTAQSS